MATKGKVLQKAMVSPKGPRALYEQDIPVVSSGIIFIPPTFLFFFKTGVGEEVHLVEGTLDDL